MTGAARRRGSDSTPRSLETHRNRLTTLLVVWAVSSIAWLAFMQAGAQTAKASAHQIWLTQQTAIQLTRADSVATAGYLQGGLQSDAATTAFHDDIAGAQSNLALMAAGVAGDTARTAVSQLPDYLEYVTAARANNRQGFPVGATYQKDASRKLSKEILPALDSISLDGHYELTDSARVATRSWPMFVLGICLVVLPVFYGLAWLASRTRRWINIGVALSLAVSGTAVLVSATRAATSASNTRRNVTIAFRQHDLAGSARVQLHAAKSAEALTLIARGSGQAYELDWQQAMATVDALLPLLPMARDTDLLVLADNYRKAHVEVRAADDAGNWDAARVLTLPSAGLEIPKGVDAATAAKAGLAGTAFDQLDQQLSNFSAQEVQVAQGVWRTLFALQLMIALAAAASIWLIRAGYNERLAEYR